MAHLGLTYTSERKDEAIVPDYRSLLEVSFLKRGFRYDEDYCRWVAPLELDSIF